MKDKLRRLWRFLKDGPYAEQIASMNATTERIKTSTAVIEEATRKMRENTEKMKAMAERVEDDTAQMSDARRRLITYGMLGQMAQERWASDEHKGTVTE